MPTEAISYKQALAAFYFDFEATATGAEPPALLNEPENARSVDGDAPLQLDP